MENSYQCNRCRKIIARESRIMHDLNCKEKKVQTQYSSPRQSQSIPQHQNYNKPQTNSQVNSGDINEEIILCEKCNTYILTTELQDHLYSHQLEDDNVEEDQSNNSQQRKQIKHVNQNAQMGHRQQQYVPNSNDNNINRQIQTNGILYNQNLLPEPQQRPQIFQQSIQYQQYPQQQYQQQQLQSNIGINRTLSQNSQGYSTETITEQLPNGFVKNSIIIRDPYHNVVSNQQSQVYHGTGAQHRISNFSMNFVPEPNQFHVNIVPRMPLNINMPNVNNRIINQNPPQNPFRDPYFDQIMPFPSGLAEAMFEELSHNIDNDNSVSEQIIDNLPVINIDDPDKLDSDKKQCVICLTDYEKGVKGIILPCIHLFHSECIKDWFKTQDTCPICKFKLNSE